MDALGTDAKFSGPWGVAVDLAGVLFIGDSGNNRIRKVTSAGMASTLAGSGNSDSADGTGTGASFDSPTGLAVDASGNVFVADRDNHRIRVVSPGGVVTTLAGSTGGFSNGEGAAAKFYFPTGVAWRQSLLAVADSENNRVRQIACAAGTSSPTGVCCCAPCAAGSFSTGGAPACTSCAAGTYNPSTGGTSAAACLQCPAGKYNPSIGGTSPAACLP